MRSYKSFVCVSFLSIILINGEGAFRRTNIEKLNFDETSQTKQVAKDSLIKVGIKKFVSSKEVLTKVVAERILYDYFRRKGVYPWFECVKMSTTNLTCVTYADLYQLNCDTFTGAIVSYWIGQPDLNGHCYQPEKALIANTKSGFRIIRDKILPKTFSIDSTHGLNIYGQEISCGDSDLGQKIRVTLY